MLGACWLLLLGRFENGRSCCSSTYDKILSLRQRNHQCQPIPVPKNDKQYGEFNIACLNFIRSQPGLANDCKLKGSPFVSLFFPTVNSFLRNRTSQFRLFPFSFSTDKP